MTPHRGAQVLGVTIFVSLAALIAYLSLGGGSYAPAEVADPCDPRPIEAPEGTEALLQQLALSALDGAACELRVPREDLLASLADPERRAAFLDERQISDETLEGAIDSGLQRAYDDAVSVGTISGVEAFLIGQAIELAPTGLIVDIARSETGQEAAAKLLELADSEAVDEIVDEAEEALDQAQGAFDTFQGLLD